MPDPTPTPDTLRAALERLCADLDDEAGHYLAAEPIHFRGLAEVTRAHAAQLRAALAASPAPTDRPDERHDTSCEQTVGFVSCNCCQRRPAAVTAPREDETAFQVVVVHDDLARALDAWLAARGLGRSRMPSAPDDLPTFCVAPALAAAPAVERATPDPDVISLAALIHDTLWNARNAVTKDSAQLLARVLIAAGVTLNETATTPTQEDAK